MRELQVLVPGRKRRKGAEAGATVSRRCSDGVPLHFVPPICQVARCFPPLAPPQPVTKISTNSFVSKPGHWISTARSYSSSMLRRTAPSFRIPGPSSLSQTLFFEPRRADEPLADLGRWSAMSLGTRTPYIFRH